MSKSSIEGFCPNGHEYTPENTGRTDRGWRFCIVCKRASGRAYRLQDGRAEKANRRAREWHKANAVKVRAMKMKNYDKIRAFIDKAKDVPCFDCGVKHPSYVMDFDHRDPSTKTINVGVARSMAATIAEIAKCDVVCSNCHRIRTWKGRTRAEQ